MSEMNASARLTDLKNLYILFYVNNETYAMDISSIREINSEFQITPVPHAPYPVEGYVNLRGQIHLIISIERLFRMTDQPDAPWESFTGYGEYLLRQSGRPKAETKKKNPLITETGPQLIIFKEEISAPSGIIVDEIGDIISVPPSDTETYRESESSVRQRKGNNAVSEKVLKLENDLVICLSAARIMDHADPFRGEEDNTR